MTAITWIQAPEFVVGQTHPTLADVVNRPLNQVMQASGFGPYVASFNGFVALTPGFTQTGTIAVSGSVTAPSFVGALTGNATTATTAGSAAVLSPGRNINGVLFDGSGNITVTAAAGTLTGTVLNAAVVTSSLTSVGTLGSLTVSGTTTVGQLTISTAASKIVPGATSLSLRNNANNADNLIVTDAGLTTLRTKIHVGLDSTQGGEASIYGLSVTKDAAIGGGGSGFAFAAEFVAIDSVSDPGLAGHLSGAQIAAIGTAAGNYHEFWGAHIYSLVSIGGTSDLAIGTYAQVSQTSGTLSCGVGVEADILRSGGTMTNAILVAVGYHSTHGSQGLNAVATNQYGVRVGPIINGTLNYAWYSEDGWMQIGDSVAIGTAIVPVANTRLFVSGPVTATGGFAQGVVISPTVGSGTTTAGFGITMQVATAAAGFTAPVITALNIGDVIQGSGSTITVQYGIKIANQTKGGTNYAIFTGTGIVQFGDTMTVTDGTVTGSLAPSTAGSSWFIGTSSNHPMVVTTNSLSRWSFDTAGKLVANATNGAGITVHDATMIHSNIAFTNGAGASAGTLTNAPAAGNPTKWIPVDDNGTTRYIPAW